MMALLLFATTTLATFAQDTTTTAPPPPPPASSSTSVATSTMGFKGGIGGAMYAGDESTAKGGFSWNVGLVYQFSGESAFAVGFQPELLFLQEVITNEYTLLGQSTATAETRFTHVRVPLNLKLALGSKDVIQPGLMAGLYGDYCFSGTTVMNNTSGTIGNLAGFGYGAVLGVDVRMLRFLCVDVKFYYALSNVLKDDPVNTRINSLMASVTFLF
ncbi:MAG: PorT family protein [Bacteroidetes bacterium]|nr:PorT family protein [Bacteroidota bacterium]